LFNEELLRALPAWRYACEGAGLGSLGNLEKVGKMGIIGIIGELLP